MSRIILETDRLLLREFVEDDAPAFFQLNRRPEVVRYTGEECATSVDQVREGIRQRPMADYCKYGFGRWAMVVKSSGELIGFAGLKFLDELQAVDLGYRLLPEYWGQGLATEASRAVVRYGFDILRLERILGLVDPEHARSIRVLEKLGFVFDKVIDYRSHPAALYYLDSAAKL